MFIRYLPKRSGDAPGRRFTVVVALADDFGVDFW
jgi:hypothetical protein